MFVRQGDLTRIAATADRDAHEMPAVRPDEGPEPYRRDGLYRKTGLLKDLPPQGIEGVFPISDLATGQIEDVVLGMVLLRTLGQDQDAALMEDGRLDDVRDRRHGLGSHPSSTPHPIWTI
jgi:hypothetical protein